MELDYDKLKNKQAQNAFIYFGICHLGLFWHVKHVLYELLFEVSIRAQLEFPHNLRCIFIENKFIERQGGTWRKRINL